MQGNTIDIVLSYNSHRYSIKSFAHAYIQILELFKVQTKELHHPHILPPIISTFENEIIRMMKLYVIMFHVSVIKCNN